MLVLRCPGGLLRGLRMMVLLLVVILGGGGGLGILPPPSTTPTPLPIIPQGHKDVTVKRHGDAQ